jgi:hypothetical protein
LLNLLVLLHFFPFLGKADFLKCKWKFISCLWTSLFLQLMPPHFVNEGRCQYPVYEHSFVFNLLGWNEWHLHYKVNNFDLLQLHQFALLLHSWVGLFFCFSTGTNSLIRTKFRRTFFLSKKGDAANKEKHIAWL